MITFKQDDLQDRHEVMSIRLGQGPKPLPKSLSYDDYMEYTIEQAREHLKHTVFYMNGFNIEPET